MEELKTKVDKVDGEFGTNIVMQRDEKKAFSIIYMGNLDIYFSLSFEDNKDTSFIIGKDNCQIFYMFDQLYKSIIDAKIYEEYPDDWELHELRERSNNSEYFDYWIELQALFDEFREKNNYYKQFSSYNNLVKPDGSILWLCDDYPEEEAPSFTIKKLDDENYAIVFARPTKKNTNFYEGSISVRIRNVSSRYDPFNTLFMQLFNSLCEIPNEYHQISLEEYIYKLEKKPN